jgi:sialic acid synthase SpsE
MTESPPIIPRFIAEVCSNHNRDLKRALALIDAAAQAGCAGVKFQLFKLDRLFSPEALRAHPGHLKRRDWELPLEFLPALSKATRQAGMLFGCTPFYNAGVKELEPYVDFFKIASYDLLRLDLIAACSESGKELVISTGMATLAEVSAAVETAARAGRSKVCLLHCVSNYPTPAAQCNLAAMDSMRREFSLPVGWSDHSHREAVILQAVFGHQADMIEFHFDVEGQGYEYQIGHCWLPREIRRVIELVAEGFLATGKGEKQYSPEEELERSWRADPADGLRPLRAIRRQLYAKDE